MSITKELLREKAEQLFETVRQTRRSLHRIPESAFCEEKTMEWICRELERIGIPYQKEVARTGVIGLIEKTGAEKTLLLRADMDALPICEEKASSYQSEHPGMMHACGHDAHMAVLLGTAELLWDIKEELSCNVKLLFQPGEEGVGGAEPMIQEGALLNPKVDAALALHVMNDETVGRVRMKAGGVMACPDEFDLKVIGKGGHGAYPEECINPITITSEIVLAFSELAKELNQPERPAVISVCAALGGGRAYNIIPQSVDVRGTVRLYDKELRERIPGLLEDIIREKVKKYDGSYEWNYRLMYPPLLNDEKMVDWLSTTCAEILGKERVVLGGKSSMAGDDFAYFAEQVPSVYFNLGSGNEEKGITMPLHSPDFEIDEDCLLTGVLSMSYAALRFGKE